MKKALLLLFAVVTYLANAQYFTKVTTGDIVTGGGTYGSSWGDYDNDGDIDVVAFQSSPVLLYRNNCAGNFTQVMDNALSTATSAGAFSPAEWIDYDNDGDLDMILYQSQGGTGVPQSAMLYQNDGSGNFTRITNGQMVNDTLSPRSASIVDFDNDGNLDVFVANRNRPNILYRNTGTGDFTKVTGSVLNALCTPNLSQGSTWGDYDNDGDMDVYVGGGGSFSCFYTNNGDGTFTQVNNSPLTNVTGSNYGPAWVDYDNDSDLDLFLQIAFAPNLLFMNNNNATFTQVTVAPFLNGNENAQGGPAFGDYDNDGDLDLFLANVNGHPNKFYINNSNGTFTENTSEIITNDTLKESSAATFADADNDGDLDLYVTVFDNPYTDHNNFFYLNNASVTSNNWFKVKCTGTQTNKQAIGARVYVKAIINGQLVTQMREINGNCNLTGGANGVVANEVHFGLGDATVIQELKIVWPKSGSTQTFANVTPNQFVNITEGNNSLQTHIACAAAGALCATAIALPAHNSTTNQTIIGTEQWFSFVADSATATIAIQNTSANTAEYIVAAGVFRGACTQMQIISSDIINPNSPIILFSASSLIAGSTYYLQLKRSEAGGPNNFNLTIQHSNTSSFCGFTGSPNTNFLNNIFSDPSTPLNVAIHNYIYNLSNNTLPTNFVYQIPVVVHVLHNPGETVGTGLNISYAQIQWQIAALNAAFSNNYQQYDIDKTPGAAGVAVDTRIRFCLAQTPIGPTGWTDNEPGVMRYPTTNTTALDPTLDFFGYNALTTITNSPNWFPYDQYLNIWSVRHLNGELNPGTVGVFADQFIGLQPNTPANVSSLGIDGIICRSDCFGDISYSEGCSDDFNMNAILNHGTIMAHEVGHYLALYHTFEPHGNASTGCVGLNPQGAVTDDCSLRGDLVCDTPPCELRNYFAGPIPNTCNIGPDMVENFMSYSFDEIMNTFTIGQALRMQATLNVAPIRRNLWQAQNLMDVGLAPSNCPPFLTAGFKFSPQIPCAGGDIQFSTPSGYDLTATQWHWTFGDGNTSPLQNPIHKYASNGTYTVTLTATDANGTSVSCSGTIGVGPFAQIITNGPIDICDGTNAVIHVQFSNITPPYNITLTNGIDNYEFTAQQSIQNLIKDFFIPITINANTVSIVAFSDANCSGIFGGSTTLNVQTCCPSFIVNGNFENGDDGSFASDNVSFLTSQSLAPGNYQIAINNQAPEITFQNLSLNINGPCNFNQNCIGLNHSNILNNPPWVLFGQQFSNNLTSGSTYLFSFDALFWQNGNFTHSNYPGGPLIMGSPPIIFQVLITNLGGGLGFFSQTFTLPQAEISNYQVWNHFSLELIVPPIVDLNLTSGIEIRQITNFDSGNFDYMIDNISLNAIANSPTVTPSAIPSSVCSGPCDGSASIAITNGPTPPYNFTWSSGATGNTSSTLCPGIYTVTISDANSCTNSEFVRVVGSITSSVLQGNPDLCIGNTQTLTATANGGSSPYTFSWSSGVTSASIYVSPVISTTYTVTVIDANGCSSITTTRVNIKYLPQVAVSGNSQICLGAAELLTVNAVGTPMFTYSWSTGATGVTSSISPIQNTSYTVTVIDAIGCVNTSSVTIVVNPNPILDAGPDLLACRTNNVINVVASGGTSPYTYSWTPSSGLSGITGASVIANPVVTTTYVVQVVDSKGCIGNDGIVVNPQLAATVNYPNGYTWGVVGIGQQNVILNFPTLISGTVTIANFASLTITCDDLRMAPGAKIVVGKNAVLEIKNASHLYTCENMWDGIYLTNSSSKVIITGGSLIEDALNAVFVGINGGNYQISNSTFNRNKIGILVNGYNKKFTSGFNNTVSGTKFLCSINPVLNEPKAMLKPPFNFQSSRAGISLTDVGKNNVTDVIVGADNKPTNYFENMDYGIYAIRTHFTARNNSFKNLRGQLSSTCAPPGICPPVVPIGIGIYTDGPFPNGYIDATNNIFNNCYRAIDCNRYTFITTNNNIIDNTTIGAQPNSIFADAGINIVVYHYPKVGGGYIICNANSIINSSVGIHILANGVRLQSQGIVISNNNPVRSGTINMTQGILVEGTGTTYLPTLIENNIVTNAINGITLRNVTDNSSHKITLNTIILNGIKTSGRGIVLQNCNSNEVSFNNIKCLPLSVNTNLRGIDITFDANSTIKNNIIEGTGTGFRIFGSNVPGTQYTCNVMYNTKNGVEFNQGNIGVQGNASFATDNQWTGTSGTSTSNPHFFNKGGSTSNPWHIRNGVTTGSPFYPDIQMPLSGFIPLSPAVSLAGCQNSCPNQPICFQALIAQSIQQPTATINPQENIFVRNQLLFDELDNNNTLMKQGTQDDNILKAFYDNLKTLQIGKFGLVKKLLQNDDLINAELENSGISGALTMISNQVKVNQSLIDLSKNDGITAMQNTELAGIAMQCPITGGRGVFEARVLLSLVNNSVFDFEDNCPLQSGAKLAEDISTHPPKSNETSYLRNIKLYPNPNDGNMILEYHLEEREKGELLLFDITGKLWSKYNIDNTSNTLTIKENELANGIYFYELRINGTLVSKEKVIVIK